MAGKLSTHVLDTTQGCPAAGMKIELWYLDEDKRTLCRTTRTAPDGRTDKPLLSGVEMKPGMYELVFFVGDYFAGRSINLPAIPFLSQVPVRFGMADPSASYHIPLLCSPWAYSTYRGS